MSVANETVHDRIERARLEVSLSQVTAVVALAAALGFVLVFLQEPLVHDAMHNFRHAAGITCH